MHLNDTYFDDDKIPDGLIQRLSNITAWFQEYAGDKFVGEELQPSPMSLPLSSQPTISSIQRYGELEVLEAVEQGHLVQVEAVIDLDLEVDLNDEEDETTNATAIVDLTLVVNLRTGKINSHVIKVARHPDS
ncbi:MAG: hypothetical protein WCL32_08160 [Planctomycetota bacterium]